MGSRRIQVTTHSFRRFLDLKKKLASNKLHKTILQHKKLLWLKTNGEAVFNIIVINFVRAFL